MESGFSSTLLWVSDEPMEETDSFAYTRQNSIFTGTSPHQLANVGPEPLPGLWLSAESRLWQQLLPEGVSITFGFTDICTASNTSRPAKINGRSQFESLRLYWLSMRETNAWTTRSTCPSRQIVCFQFVAGQSLLNRLYGLRSWLVQ